MSKKKKEDIRVHSIDNATSFQKSFADLISTYKDKGYKVSDLSTKNNLFDPTPLLLENDKIVSNFKILQNTKPYLKDLGYLHRIGGTMVEKLFQEGKKNSSNPIIPKNKDSSVGFELIKHTKTTKELLDEIKANEKYINETNKIIQSNEHKHIFDLYNLDLNRGGKISIT